MSILRVGDIVAIIGKVSGVSADGSEADIYFHMDNHYNEDQVILVDASGLKLMEHGDPDYGVKIIEGIEGEWKIQSRLSKAVAVMQKIDSDPNAHENFQVVAIDRLKTQDKDLYRLVTGADLKKNQAIESAPAKAEDAPAESRLRILDVPSLSGASAPQASPSIPATPVTTAAPEAVTEKPADRPMPITMMRPDKLSSIAQPSKIMAQDQGLEDFIAKADQLAEGRVWGESEATNKIDLSTIADCSAEYKTNT